MQRLLKPEAKPHRSHPILRPRQVLYRVRYPHTMAATLLMDGNNRRPKSLEETGGTGLSWRLSWAA